MLEKLRGPDPDDWQAQLPKAPVFRGSQYRDYQDARLPERFCLTGCLVGLALAGQFVEVFEFMSEIGPTKIKTGEWAQKQHSRLLEKRGFEPRKM
jgi:hypothetical protein